MSPAALPEDPLNPLVELGFTPIEARVYVCLLKRSPLTGYAIAKAIDKPTANTYKALESLANRGAVIIDEGHNRLCRATPAGELLGRLRARFEQSASQAQRIMSKLRSDSTDQRIYHLRSVEQVFGQVRTMLHSATQIIVADLFPPALEELHEDFCDVANSGVGVYLCVYAKACVPGCNVVCKPVATDPSGQWPGIHVSVACDAQQHIYALLEPGMQRVMQAIWSESAYLSCMAHSHLSNEFELTRYLAGGEELESLPIRLVRDRLPGFLRLQSLFSKHA